MSSDSVPAPADAPGSPDDQGSSAAGSTALKTDKYELTMVRAALADGTAGRRCTFEVFARSLPPGRRYGVVGGIGRFVEQLRRFRFSEADIDSLGDAVDDRTREWMRSYRFRGDIDAYPEGETYFPGSPILTVRGTFAECVVLETLALSVLNHDSAVAAAGARMTSAAHGRPIIEMGGRRTHEDAAVAAARIARLVGFQSTSNLEAARRYGVPSGGTAAHAFVLLHTDDDGPDEAAAFRSQVEAQGVSTTLLVDTYDITRGIDTAIEVAGTDLGGIRIDSGDLGVMARRARDQLDRLGADRTRIIVSGDLDEFAIAGLSAEPVDAYGVGTRFVMGSGAPTASMVYKLVEVDGRPVSKRSSHKESLPGAKEVVRTYRPTGTAVEEILYPAGGPRPDVEPGLEARPMLRPLIRSGEPVPDLPTLAEARQGHADAMVSLPWEGLKLSAGEPALPTRVISPGAPT